MSSYRVAIIPGDGVGTEVASEAAKTLRAVADKHGFRVEMKDFDWGCDYYLKNGIMMPANALDILQEFSAIFLGCIGDANKVPDHVSLTLLLAIRKGFDQYINLRPIKLYPGVESPVKTATPETVDMIVIRENTEGEYSAAGGFFKLGTPDAAALQTGIFTQKGCERAIRYAFELARKRKKFGDEVPVG
ncbi:MAG: isocitrate/isopropylmalate family dehydrogenase, partial [Dehalococcoidia bacterium]